MQLDQWLSAGIIIATLLAVTLAAAMILAIVLAARSNRPPHRTSSR